MRVWFQYRFTFIVRCWMPVGKSNLLIENRRYWKYYINLIDYPPSSWLCPVMTIDKNEPDDIPADEKNGSPNSKEITEKVTNHAIQLNAQTLNKCSTIWCRSIANYQTSEWMKVKEKRRKKHGKAIEQGWETRYWLLLFFYTFLRLHAISDKLQFTSLFIRFLDSQFLFLA